MEEEQNQNQEEQPEVVVEQPKKKTIPTCLGSLIVLLVATIAGAGVWWYSDSYTSPEVVDVSEVVEQMKEKRETKNELLSDYEIKADEVYYKGNLIEGADLETFVEINDVYAKDINYLYVEGKPTEEMSYNFGRWSGGEGGDELPDGYEIIDGVMTYLNVDVEMIHDNYRNEHCIGKFEGSQTKNTGEDILIFVSCRFSPRNPNGYLGALGASDMKIYRLDIKNNILQEIFLETSDEAYIETFYGLDYADDSLHKELILSETWRVLEVKEKLTIRGDAIRDTEIQERSSFYCFDQDKKEYFSCGRSGGFSLDLGGGLACLATGTKISMSDGNYKNIEDVEVGDSVISYEVETKEHTISKVDKVIKRKDPLVIINNTLRTAPDEPIYLVDGSIKEATDIKVGDYLLNEKGEQAKVNTIKRNIELVDTYDFTLENGNNFFADGYLVRTPDL